MRDERGDMRWKRERGFKRINTVVEIECEIRRKGSLRSRMNE